MFVGMRFLAGNEIERLEKIENPNEHEKMALLTLQREMIWIRKICGSVGIGDCKIEELQDRADRSVVLVLSEEEVRTLAKVKPAMEQTLKLMQQSVLFNFVETEK